MILIEVKAFGYFTNQQINSKVRRWRLLKKYADQSVQTVTLRFMLMSRIKPVGLLPPPDDLLPGKNDWPHATLRVNLPAQKLKVTGRKPGAQSPALDQNIWFIVPALAGGDEEDDLDGPI